MGKAWHASYSPERNRAAIEWLADKPVAERIMHLLARIAFRGIYFPQVSRFQWFRCDWAELALGLGSSVGSLRKAPKPPPPSGEIAPAEAGSGS